jgi:hypothetical protein
VTDQKTGIERRRDRRYPFRLVVVLAKDGKDVTAYTEDVSFTGFFLRVDIPLPDRWLVRLRLKLPPDGDELAVMGMAARQTVARAGLPPGVGILLYSLSAADRKRWNRFIHFVAEAPPELKAEAAATAVVVPEPVRRHDPRFPMVLQVRLQTVDDIRLLYTRNVSKGGLFVATALETPEGTPMKVRIIHPKTGEHFLLDAAVRWRSTSGEVGLGLEFVQLTDQRRDQLMEFISSEIPVEEVAYIADGDRPMARGLPAGTVAAKRFTTMAPAAGTRAPGS